jgi:hypothetical protein
MDEVLREVSAFGAKLENMSDNLARHQSELSALSECVSEIKLARAAERGYIAGALAVGGLIGGIAVKVLL